MCVHLDLFICRCSYVGMHVRCESPFQFAVQCYRSDHTGCCSLFTRGLLSDCQQIAGPFLQSLPLPTTAHPSRTVPSLKSWRGDVTERVLRHCSSEMDRQVETDRPRNTKGNIGSLHIMRPVNLNASRPSSEQGMADD